MEVLRRRLREEEEEEASTSSYNKEEEEEASTSSYNKEGFSIPYFAGEIQIHESTQLKKRVFRFKRIHSIRDRGRSGISSFVARKLDRFKVRLVGVRDPPNDTH